ncbi:MAG: 6-bladed beta-propeller [Terriglobales bacterium]
MISGGSSPAAQYGAIATHTQIASARRLPDRIVRRPVAPSPLAGIAGDRRIDYLRSIASEKDVNPNRSFWNKLLDIVAGAPKFRHVARPYGITTDSRGRIIISDPGAQVVHIFDFAQKKYHHLEGGRHQHFESPIGVATDAADNIYVTDSVRGKIYVFDKDRHFRRFLGERGGEGMFKRPTGIVIDAAQRRMYVSDTLHHKIYTLDLEGNVLGNFGERGTAPGQFNFPTDLALRDGELLVLDSMNFRVQAFDTSGRLRRVFGSLGNATGTFNRAKGLAVDSEGNIYTAESLFETMQIFDGEGRFLYYFGNTGGGPGEFQLPAGVWIDPHDRVYVADSLNRRVQVFQFVRARRENLP